ncbi:MAG: MarR family winged helix-turn-helix transcriptional regulator [Lachnospiraceae bacterium]
MERLLREQFATLTRLYREQDEIYRRLAAKSKMSETCFWVLYSLASESKEYTQQDLCNLWYYSKQTINSAISWLVKQEYIYLQVGKKNKKSKIVILTEKGKEFCKMHIVDIFLAEERAFCRFSEKEREQIISLMERDLVYLKEEVEKIE